MSIVKLEENQITCQNCDRQHHIDDNFCPHCGQSTADDLTIGVLFYNTISNYFSFDARFLKSFIPLMFRPGYLASRFIEGKRLLYLHPAQMYLFVSVIFFFIISFSTRELANKAEEINQKVAESEIIDELSHEAQVVIDSVVTEEAIKQGILDTVGQQNRIKGLDNAVTFGLGEMEEEEQVKLDSILKSQGVLPEDGTVSFDLRGKSRDSANSSRIKVNNADWDIFNRKKVDSLIKSGAEDTLIYKEMGMKEDAGYIKQRLYKSALNLYKGSGAGAIVQAFFDSIPLAMFFLLPIFAFILKIFYFNKGKYAHHLVFSFYYFSFLFTVFAIVFAVNRFVKDIPDWIDWLVALSTFWYFFIALMKFYRQHWFWSLFKSSVITFIFLLMVIPTTFLVVGAFAVLFY